MSEIDGLIQRLDAWLQENRPEYYALLGDGATDEEISFLEASLDTQLPEDFKKFLQWKNIEKNETSESYQIMPLWMGLSIRSIDYEAHWMIDFCKMEPDIGLEWHEKFVPFMYDACGDYICIDTVGAWDGNIGQIINYNHDCPSSIEIDSFTRWLQAICICLESGCWFRHQHGEGEDWFSAYYRVIRELSPGLPKEKDN